MSNLLTDSDLEQRRKQAEFIAKVWKYNLERNRLLSVPSNKPVDMNSESV